MLGGASFFLRVWRPRDGRSKGLFDSLASPLDSRSRPAMPDRMERGSPKSSSNSSAFMSILFVFYGAARAVVCGSAVPCMGEWRRRGAPEAGLRVAAPVVSRELHAEGAPRTALLYSATVD